LSPRHRQGEPVPRFSQTEVLLWIVALIVLEIYHLKWIYLSEWSCRKCGEKHLHCPCESRKWVTYL
jgi:hypothetical protein